MAPDYANVPSEFGQGGDYSGGKAYAEAQAALAASENIQIFTVSVGSSLMESIAVAGGGEHLAASGATVAQMSTQLNAIFQHLGGRRQVELIR